MIFSTMRVRCRRVAGNWVVTLEVLLRDSDWMRSYCARSGTWGRVGCPCLCQTRSSGPVHLVALMFVFVCQGASAESDGKASQEKLRLVAMTFD